MQILVVDDDPLTLHMVVSRMRQWGYDVVSCTDGESAWKLLEDGTKLNMAIVDWMMPGIKGPELCQKIRERTDCPYVYIILLTGRSKPEDLIAGLDAGADDYLTKPFHLGELDARLRAGKRIVDLQNELITARETLRIQAMHEPFLKWAESLSGRITPTIPPPNNRRATAPSPDPHPSCHQIIPIEAATQAYVSNEKFVSQGGVIAS